MLLKNDKLVLIPRAQIQTGHKSPKMSLKQNVNTHKSRVVKTSAELLSSVPVCTFFSVPLRNVIKPLSEHAQNFLVFSSNDRQFGITPILKSSGDTETSHSFPSKEGWHLQSRS